MEDEISTTLNMYVEAKGTWNIKRQGSVTFGRLADIPLDLGLSQWTTKFGPFRGLRRGRDGGNGLRTIPVGNQVEGRILLHDIC